MGLKYYNLTLFDSFKSTLSYIIKSIEYQNEYGQLCKTMKGEWVKSKGEKTIADYFLTHNIAYQYERPAYTDEFWLFSERISKPDFFLPNYNVYVEYWGLLNAKDYRTRTFYRKSMAHKMKQYESNNIRYISLYPDNLSPEASAR